MKLFRTAEHPVGLTEGREGCGGRLHLQRRTRRQRRRRHFPRPFEDALHEVVHDERSFAKEAALPGLVMNMKKEFVPFALFERAHRDLMTEDLSPGALVG